MMKDYPSEHLLPAPLHGEARLLRLVGLGGRVLGLARPLLDLLLVTERQLRTARALLRGARIRFWARMRSIRL